jgi:hypothetical protein
MKRIVLFVEGQGDVDAAPVLVSKLLKDQEAYDVAFLDRAPFRVGNAGTLLRNDMNDWCRHLQSARKRENTAAIIMLLDGDLDRVNGADFCPYTVAQLFASKASDLGAGINFSVAIAFALQEFESWLIAGVESIAGAQLPDGRNGIKAGTVAPVNDLEAAPRDAKGWLSSASHSGYKESRDQVLLTKCIDWELVKNRPMRSYIRLENAVSQIVNAIRTDTHVATPA